MIVSSSVIVDFQHEASVEAARVRSKISGHQIVRPFVTASVNFGCGCINQITIQIEGPEKSGLIKPYAGLNSLQCIFMHEK